MWVVVVLVLVTLSAILAQVNVGDPCGEDIGQITLIGDCTTAIIVPNTSGDKTDWYSSNRLICCIRNSYLTHNNKPLRKSEKACADFGPGIQRKVFSTNYVQPGEYQHNVALGYRKNTTDYEITWGLCSGVLVSKDYVVTNAHCILTPFKRGLPLMVRAGTIDQLGEEDRVKPQDIEILETIVHPDYSNFRKLNDIALIKLAEPANFTSYVQPACLYTKKDVPDKMIVTGWGWILETDSGIDDLLLKSDFVTVNMKNCNDLRVNRKRNLTDSEFCGITGTHICNPASGSAAFVTQGDDSRATVVGLTTYGPTVCSSQLPTVYTKISSFLDWLESIIWP